MKKILVLLLLLSATRAGAIGFDAEGAMVLEPQEIRLLEECRASGSRCALMSAVRLQQFIEETIREGLEEGAAQRRLEFEKALDERAQALGKEICRNQI